MGAKNNLVSKINPTIIVTNIIRCAMKDDVFYCGILENNIMYII